MSNVIKISIKTKTGSIDDAASLEDETAAFPTASDVRSAAGVWDAVQARQCLTNNKTTTMMI